MDKKEKSYIICVDDERTVLNSLKEQLRNKFENEYVIEVAESGEEAMELIHDLLDSEADIPIVISDYIMPGMKGDELLTQVNAVSHDSVKILLTGQATMEGITNSINKANLYRFIPKPWVKEDLILTIKEGIKCYYNEKKIEEQNRFLIEMNMNLDALVKALQNVIQSFQIVLKIDNFDDFLSNILSQFNNILSKSANTTPFKSGLIISKQEDVYTILSGTGDYKDLSTVFTEDLLTPEIIKRFDWAVENNIPIINENYVITSISTGQDDKYVIFLDKSESIISLNKEIIEIFCTNSSIVLDNILLKKEIESTQKEIIFTLSEIAEARSRETGNHVKRVAEFSKIIALGYGLSETEAEILRLSAPLHDIGKLAIPDSILNKPAKLTFEEFEIMKTHTKIGYEMLKSSTREILKAASIIALQHHERIDGTGYPDSRKGNEIHIYGRIIALADVFDALGNDRVYKKAWELDKVLEYIQAGSGKHFDAALVRIFMEKLPEIINIKKLFGDKYTRNSTEFVGNLLTYSSEKNPI